MPSVRMVVVRWDYSLFQNYASEFWEWVSSKAATEFTRSPRWLVEGGHLWVATFFEEFSMQLGAPHLDPIDIEYRFLDLGANSLSRVYSYQEHEEDRVCDAEYAAEFAYTFEFIQTYGIKKFIEVR